MPRIRLIVALLLIVAPQLRADDKPKHPANRLARETSPYLLQHAHNPVEWYPWGPEAFEKAKKEGKPIFLSVGYSSCYWCHVMERESFEDEAIAKALNEKFVCIKVDREERPDVDGVYMAALQSFSGSGGWPMSLFLFPDGRPFFAATYLPPRDKDDREGFATLIDRVNLAWRDHRDELDKDANNLSDAVRKSVRAVAAKTRVPLAKGMLADGQAALAEQYDPDFGGFGYDPNNSKKPKFPEPSNLVFLLHRAGKPAEAKRFTLGEREGKLKGPDPKTMVLVTLDRMARGGIRDHLAGGYHRYSTNRSWTIPHFEKMLYDNAQLASVHLLAFEATKDERWKREAEATFAFLDRTMTSPEGAFYSAIDAETAGNEGAYYVWTEAEVEKVLGKGADFELFSRTYGLDRGPNFENDRFVFRESRSREELAKALDTTPEDLEKRLAPMRAKLLAARETRPAPRLDDKILTAWNGLAIAAYADGFRVLKEPRYRAKAEKAADFLLGIHFDKKTGRLLRTSRGGKAKGEGYLEDYAFLAHGLLRLHAATGTPERLTQARYLTDRMMAEFSDKDGGFFFTADGGESLLARMKDPFDNALPGANSVAIRNLVALHRLTKEAKYLDAAGQALESFSAAMAEMPAGMPLMLVGLDEYLDARGGDPAKPATGVIEGIPTKSVLSAKAALAPGAKVAPGSEVDVVLTLTLQDGWHIYANPSGSEVVKPTVISLPPDSPATLVKVDYPRGKALVSPGVAGEKADVYDGSTTIQARVKLDAKAAPGGLEFLVNYQPCNDRACLAPARLRVSLKMDGR